MKTQISTLTTLTILTIAIFFGSCQKQANVKTEKTPYLKTAGIPIDMIDPLDFDGIRQLSFNEHNNYMMEALIAYQNGDLGTNSTLNNMLSQLTWSENYFSSFSSIYEPQIWSSISTDTENDFNSGQMILDQRINEFNISTPSDYKTYALKITDAMDSIVNGDTLVDFILVCDITFNDMKADTDLSDDDKTQLSAIIGVAEGSFEFWNMNLDSWTETNTPTSHGGSRLTTKEKKIILFAMADTMGALDGAAAGSVLPGVGTAAGAVLGAALASGLTAWFW